MPLIVLLQDVFAQLTKSAEKLRGWNELVGLEALLVARGRSAFMAHWFGTLIPLDGSSVRVAIVNLEALRQRYNLVMSKRRSRLSEGPSVLEPAAGIAGSIAGAALSPLNFMSVMVFAEPFIGKKLGTPLKKALLKLGVVVNWLAWGALGPIAFVLLAAAGPVLIAGFAAVPGTANLQDFLTAATRIVKPLTEFWRQVSGPRAGVKNPIVRAALGVLDKLAVLFPFFMQTAAFLIGKVGPLLDPLLHQFRALGAYVSEVIDLAAYSVTGFVDLIDKWLDPRRSGSLPHYLNLASEAFSKLLYVLIEGSSQMLIDDAQYYFLRMANGLTAYFDAVKEWIGKRFDEILGGNPMVVAIRAAIKRIETLTPFFGRLKSSPKKESKESEDDPNKFAEAVKYQFKDVVDDVEWLKHNVPELGTVDVDALLRRYRLSTFPTIVPIVKPATDPFAEVRTKFAARPRSIFAGERQALDATAIEQFELPNVAMAVAQAHIDETRLREALLTVAANVLPPEMQPYLKQLSDGMEQAEKGLGQKPVKTGARTFPVLDLPADQRLRPVVGRLVVRVRGAAREATEEWTEGLRVTLQSQLYPMPAAAGGLP